MKKIRLNDNEISRQAEERLYEYIEDYKDMLEDPENKFYSECAEICKLMDDVVMQINEQIEEGEKTFTVNMRYGFEIYISKKDYLEDSVNAIASEIENYFDETYKVVDFSEY